MFILVLPTYIKISLIFSNFRLLAPAIAQVKVLKQIRPIAPRGTLSGIPGLWMLIPKVNGNSRFWPIPISPIIFLGISWDEYNCLTWVTFGCMGHVPIDYSDYDGVIKCYKLVWWELNNAWEWMWVVIIDELGTVFLTKHCNDQISQGFEHRSLGPWPQISMCQRLGGHMWPPFTSTWISIYVTCGFYSCVVRLSDIT